MMASSEQNRIKIAQDYFRFVDQGRPELLDLFHEDAEIH